MNSSDDKTRIPFAIVNVVAFFATVLTLYRSHLPGGSDLNGFGVLIWLLVGPIWIWMLIQYNRARRKAGKSEEVQTRLMKRRLLIVPIMAGLCVLPLTQLPQFICFWLFRPHLDHVARKAHETRQSDRRACPGDKPREQHGPFPVYDVVVDKKNDSVWIVTSVRMDGLGPDTLVDGFVMNPTKGQTPFGRKYYDKTGPLHMKDNWYIFEASNDY